MEQSDIGIVGVGTMGAMLAMNMAEHGYRVSMTDRNPATAQQVKEDAGSLAPMLTACAGLSDFVQSLAQPRAVLLMLPAGAAVDEQVEALRAHLDDADLIIDAGNANFRDTQRRAADLADGGGPSFLGIGVSGGAEGARFGPAIMGGGDKGAWQRVAPVLTTIAAEHEGKPCAAWLGSDGAGHFVKMVHNGIEYADMQMIAEVYGILRDGMDCTPAQVSEYFEEWNSGALQSYLVEITAKVSAAMDPESGEPILDRIRDVAGQKGTGRWSLIEAQHLGACVSVIEAAVAARNLSGETDARVEAQKIYGASSSLGVDIDEDTLERALIAGKIICYAQGFDLLVKASKAYGWDISPGTVAELWRNGCIIRSVLLTDMAAALDEAGDRNLCFAPELVKTLRSGVADLRQVVVDATIRGIPVPALSAALSYHDTLRSNRGTANMIQAQRDFFGAHGFERTDQSGSHYGPWGIGVKSD